MSEIRVKFFPDSFYHVYSHANGFDSLFRKDRDYNLFLSKYAKYIEQVASTYAYCLMPNHFHFLIRTKSEKDIRDALIDFSSEVSIEINSDNFTDIISRQFGHLLNSHTQWYNRLYDRKGSLFIPNIKREHVDSDAYLTNLIGYIHNNPVHHGFCVNMLDWPHSSVHAYLTDKPTRLEKGFVESCFGSKEAFIRFHKENKHWRPIALS